MSSAHTKNGAEGILGLRAGEDVNEVRLKMKTGQHEDQVQISADGRTVWVHTLDGSTVGRFSKVFGMDVHRTISEQLAGAGQCLWCTHEAPGPADWSKFCDLMLQHYGIAVDRSVVSFTQEPLE